MEQSDAELVKACRNGDESAWEKLILRYQRLIYSIPRRAGLDEDTATEIFQNVFASFIEKLDTIEQPDRIQAWLVTTAKRETWRFIFKQKNLQTETLRDEVDGSEALDLPDNAPLADEVLLRLEAQNQVRNAVETLDERCHRLLKMLFYTSEPPTYAEITAALGIPSGSIGPTRARCLQKLLTVLQGQGFV
ncbi:MAG: sigma-70 family RNA polymerase sigma factor [Acidobacteriota bacterium]